MSLTSPIRFPRRSLMQRAGLLGLGAGAAATLAACGGNSPGGSGDEKVTLRFAQGMDPARLKAYKTWVDSWNGSNPNLQVSMENVPFDNYYQKLQTQTAAGTMPDLWLHVAGYGNNWLDKGLALPLDDYIAKDSSVNIDDYNKTIRDLSSVDGKLYALPYDSAGQVILYNKDLFDELNLEYPKEGWTFDEMAQTAAEIAGRAKSSKGKVYGLLGQLTGNWTSDGFYRAFGARLIGDDRKIAVNNSAGVAALTYFKKLIDSGVSPKPTTGAGGQTSGALFGNGLGGMLIEGGWAFSTLLEQAKFKWDASPLPVGPAGPAGVVNGGAYAIAKSTKHPEQAYKFLTQLTSTDALSQIVTATGAGLPGRQSSEAGLSDLNKKYAGIIRTYGAPSTTTGVLEVWTLQDKIFEQVWTGSLTPEEALRQIEEQGNGLLES